MAMVRRSRSEDGEYVIVFGGYNGSKEEPTLMKGGVPHTTIEWYSIPVPDAESRSNYSALKLTPFSVGELHKVNRFESLKSSIYCLSGCSDEMWILNSTDDCWNRGPNRIVSRRNPHTLVLDGKLYVLGGLDYPPRHSCHWMEVFDPGFGRWEALPNPPSPIYPYLMVSAAFEDTKEILVSSVQQPKSKNDRYKTCVLYSYDVRARSWTKLASPHFKLQGGGPDPTFNRAVVAANTLHWVWFDNKVELVLQAYHLPTNAWFQGRLSLKGIVLRKDEYLSDMDPPALIHLSHLSGRKFCVPIQSYFFSTKKIQFYAGPFLCSVIFEVSEDDKQVEQDYGILNISVMSVQKYRLDHSLRFSNAVLLDGAFNASMQKKPKLCAN